MARTLLDMTNEVLVRLRQDEITALADEQSMAVVKLINAAVRDVIGTRDWPFDRRFDGMATFFGPVTSTGGTFTLASDTATLVGPPGNAIGPLTAYGTARARIQVTNATDFPQTLYEVDYFEENTPSQFFAHLINPWWGATLTAAADWKVWVYEHVLPETVRSVKNIVNEEQPIALHFVEDDWELERWMPRDTDSASTNPLNVYVGGTATNSYSVFPSTPSITYAQTTGRRMLLWPVPDGRVLLHYTYMYRHPEMTEATDTLSGVPESVVDLVVSKAFEKALGSIKKDSEASSRVHIMLEGSRGSKGEIQRTFEAERPQPNYRMIPTPFGDPNVPYDPRARWANRVPPEPS